VAAATSRGHRIYYEMQGFGPPLVLIPGLLMTTKRWELAGYQSLASRFQLVMLDTLGHGRSDRPDNATAYSRAGVAADVIAVMDAAGVDKAHVWGYSRGGGIAANVATLYPDRVRSLIMGGSLPNQAGRLVTNATERVEALRRDDWGAFWTSMGLSRDAQLEAALQAGTDAPALAEIIEASSVPDGFENDFAPLRDRILVYAGSNDLGLSEKAALEALEKRCNEIGARLELLEGLNHAEAFQRSDLVMPFVRDFLSKLP
jgi:pimeloyl-ACP methyl ester carboxylesterase